MDCQRTNPRGVRAGMEGGTKSDFGEGRRECAQPRVVYIHERVEAGKVKSAGGVMLDSRAEWRREYERS
jgi:hypothetical protein